MNLLIALVETQSTGVNWAQALAIWVPIVGGLVGIIVALIAGVKSFKKWREEREDKNLMTLKGIVDGFGLTLNVKFDRIDKHLQDQDKRLSRIDRNTGTDST